MNPLTYLPAKFRAWFYGTYAAVGVAGGAISAYDAAVHASQPHWLLGGMAAYGFVGIATGITALSNVTRDTQPGPQVDPAVEGATANAGDGADEAEH